MINQIKLCALFLTLLLCSHLYAQENKQVNVIDTAKNTFNPKELKQIGLPVQTNPFFIRPQNVKKEVQYDPVTNLYIISERVGGKLISLPQYLTVEQYMRLVNSEIKRDNWRMLSNQEVADIRKSGIIPEVRINSKAFEKIFGSTLIDIQPSGEAELTFLGRVNKNENPLFNERQRVQTNFDFNQRIQMDVVGNIGTKMKIKMNYNTEAQFDFENQIKLDYTGGADDIIKKIEAGNVSLPLNTSLIKGTQALFGVKTQFQFGKLGLTTVFSQQKSQSKEIQISNGAQQNDFRISGSDYEANKHYFLAQFFRDRYNQSLANPPTILSGINITKIEVWLTNKTGSTQDSRDVLAFLDLGENAPYNTNLLIGGGSVQPSGFLNPTYPQQSNNLLTSLSPDARLTNSNAIIGFFNGSGGTDNFAKLTYARKLTDRDFTLQPQLGYISLNMQLNTDEVLAVAYRYTYNGVEYQVGEFSTDVPFDQNTPKVLYTKLLKNETIKTNLPTWNLMMKNIYNIGGYQISSQNFKLDIFRLDETSGVERPIITEGANTINKQWINITGLDRLNLQRERKPDGVFDFIAENKPFVNTINNANEFGGGLSTNGSGSAAVPTNTSNGYITIEPVNGRIIFPVLEPFGKDLAAQFNQSSEQVLINKYTYPQLYDSVKVSAQQNFPGKDRYIIKGSYQSDISSEFNLNAINVPEGSVKVFLGTMPLVEGADYTVDYMSGRVKILNTALLSSGQSIRISTENNELFGLQQRSLFGVRGDYRVNNKLNIGGTLMNLTEKPISAKVNFGEEPISNTMWGFDVNYTSPSRFLTKLVDKIPLISTKEKSTVTFYGEFAQLIPGHPSALNFAGTKRGTSYLDDFEASRSVIDLKGAISWQISGTPQLFSESQYLDDLRYGYNRAKIAFYNIDPTFYNRGGSSQIPASLRNNKNEMSNHYVREITETEVFPYKQISTGQPITLPTLDLAYYPNLRGPYNYTTTGVNADGTLQNPKQRWGGLMRKIDINDFESQNIEYIELWLMDPFIYKPNSQGGDLYFNLGNISEDILKDGKKSAENALPADDDPSKYEETNWGRVVKLQPVIQAFDNDPEVRKKQDVGLDGLSSQNERAKFASFLTSIKNVLNPAAAAALDNDPSSDDYSYFRGPELDKINAGILKRYENYNGTEGNSKTPQQSMAELGVENSASTSLPDGEDINRDNNMSQSDDYFQYKISMRPGDLVVGQNFVTDKVVTPVKLANGQTQNTTWYQIRIPIAQVQQTVGNIRDFKSIRFIRMFMTNFADTAVLRFAKIQLVRGEWRQYNAKNESNQVIVDPSLIPAPADNSTMELSTVNIEENGKRSPIPYVVPPGIERERDFSNYRGDTRQNEQSLAMTVKNLKDGYGRAAFRTALSDFRAYKRLEMFIHLEAVGNSTLSDNDLQAFIRIGTDHNDNYYEYNQPLKVTLPNTSDPYAIWPDANKMDLDLELLQQAKIARNNARTTGGMPWPLNIPFTYVVDGKTIVVKGQPDMSKVRVYMLGVKNPLRNPASPSGDDGLTKDGMLWFNELRLTGFDERSGWAATARMSAKLADFADVNISGTKSTVGFGSIESRVSERKRTDDEAFDISSNIELGKFLPQRSGVKIPMFVSYSKQIATPQFDPRTPDIELSKALNNANKEQKDSILNFAQDYTTRSSIAFTNVHKERKQDDKVRLWDIENFNVTYAQTKLSHRDFVIERNIQNTYRASLAYNYAYTPKSYQPFDKIIKSNSLKLLKDFNFSLLPNSINFRVDVDRYYAENTLRNNDPNNYLPIQTTYSKNFLMSRIYGIAWDLTKSLSLDFDATNYSIIDEPDGRIEGLKRDTLWNNLKNLGRTTDYNHSLNVRYSVPINKIPGLDWVNVATTYGTTFNWQTEPLATLRDPNINLGNTIQNSRTIQVNPTLNFVNLYNKFGFYRRGSKTTDSTFNIGKLATGILTSIKSINVAFTQTKGTFLPGYLPRTKFFGMDDVTGAPGLGFVFGSQRDIRMMALNNGWLTTDPYQEKLYVNTLREDFQLTSTIEPINDLKITLNAGRNRTLNYSTNFRYDNVSNSFKDFSPNTTGDYSISIISLRTAFKEKNGSIVSEIFNQFMANRSVISQRLGNQNPNSNGEANGYADGYNKDAHDVVVEAFLAAYTGKNAGTMRLNTLPKIPLPNWRLTYSGLTKIAFLAERFSELSLRHGYRSTYSVNGFNTLLKYQETDGYVSSRDVNQNFLPYYQFAQVSISEQFAPLIGIDARLKSNLTANFEINRTRLLGLSLSNSQLAHLSENNFVFGLGYRTNKFRFPFGWFSNLRLDNNMDFKLDVAVRDNKTVIYRADISEAEVSSGAKNITLRPSVDYVLNQRFNLKIFYDSNITKPYTSQSFNTSFSNFGFSLRATLN
ncbi:T9SS outer membrane translocon Sov/SprA [Pedobacter montanisoli]|uniref:Cell surface protein SprA n=1 Tax=Pedobacter montanisoli TaxID=2923277 RepID=A0ABS9ZSA2_9SPHI|nr:cell surface protein SprA [Pedobacter montanisoli]MCJ0741456.1 cell surface protein SprA [Pedobacter montanisoli]